MRNLWNTLSRWCVRHWRVFIFNNSADIPANKVSTSPSLHLYLEEASMAIQQMPGLSFSAFTSCPHTCHQYHKLLIWVFVIKFFITWGHFDNSQWSTSPAAHGWPRLASSDDLVGGGRECEWRRIDWNSDPAIGVNLQFRLITDILSIRINEHGWCIKYVWPVQFYLDDYARQLPFERGRRGVRDSCWWRFCSTTPPCTKSLSITDLIVKNPNKQKLANVRFNVKPNVWYTLQSASYLT